MTGYHLAVACDSATLGGAERVLEVLVGGLPDRVRVTVVGPNEAVVDKVVTARTGADGVVVPATFGAMWSALGRIDPDIVHVNLTMLNGCRAATSAALARRIPVVLVDHLPARGLRRRGRALQRLTTRLAVARVSVGERSSRQVEVWAGLRPGTVRTIRNGVPGVDVTPPEPTEGALRVAVLSRLAPHKSLDVLLRALVRVPAVTATIGGNGPLEGELRRLAAELGLGDRVSFLGWCDPATVLGSADAIVLPSAQEGAPLALIEAMHAGYPVIATRVGSVPEVVADGVTGLLVDAGDDVALADALRRFAASPDLRARMGAAGRERAARMFSPGCMVANYDRLYAAAAAGVAVPVGR